MDVVWGVVVVLEDVYFVFLFCIGKCCLCGVGIVVVELVGIVGG